jgi:hypothetical protein
VTKPEDDEAGLCGKIALHVRHGLLDTSADKCSHWRQISDPTPYASDFMAQRLMLLARWSLF